MTPTQPTVRPAVTPEDASQLLILIERLADYESLSPPDEAAQKRFLEDGFKRQPPRFEALLAEVEGTPRGYAIYFETYSTFLCRPTLYLEDLFVLPESRTGGIGKAILRHLVKEAIRRGCGRVEWTCLDWNETAQKFYAKTGAKHHAEWFFYRMDREAMEGYIG